MLRIVYFFLAAGALLSSCAGPYRDTCLYQKSGGVKPIVALLPVITPANNREASGLPWDLSEELTEEIRRRFFDSNRLYFLDVSGSKKLAKDLNTNNISALSRLHMENVGASQFVVVTELIDQKVNPYKVGTTEVNEAGAELSLDFRIRVVDVRGESPKIVLQELLHHDHFIPRAYLHSDYEKAAWGTEAFDRTPVGMAHNRLANEVVARVEGYIQSVR